MERIIRIMPAAIISAPAKPEDKPDSIDSSCLLTGEVTALIGLNPPTSSTSSLCIQLTNTPLIFSSRLNIISSGRKIITAIRLKMSWIVAAWKALRYSSAFLMWPILTMVLVILVPTFAPIIIGTARVMGRPPATIATIIEVTVLDD